MDLAHDLRSILVQERTLVYPRFDTGHAWSLGTRLREMALARGHALVIEIGTFGQPLFFAALEGATPDNVAWVRRKRQVVEHFRCSSYALGLQLKQSGATLADKHGLPVADYAPHGGAFPITLAGTGVIGTVAVSGLPQREDHALVVEALAAELGHDYAALALSRE